MQEQPSRRPKVYIVIYSLYHHIYKLSLAIREELEANGVDAQIFQVPETLSDQVLEKMHAPAKPDVPVIQVNQLAEPDGLFFGIPTRFGIFPAQMKALLDASGKLWAKGSLAGKFVATFFSTASQHGGQETTALNAVTYFAHHGLMYVPFGFANASLFRNDEVIGGSAYGAGTITNGDGSRQPSEPELAIAKNQAANFAKVLNQYHRGKLAPVSAPAVSAAAAAAPAPVAAAPAESSTAGPSSTTGDAAASSSSTAAAGAAVTGAAAGAAATGAAVGTSTATSSTTNPVTTGADSDASIRSLRAASSRHHDGRDMPMITTTNPEGLTEHQNVDNTVDDVNPITEDVTGPPPAAAAAAGVTSSSTTAGATNATTAQQPSSTRPNATAQTKPKKKKRFLFCCGGDGLD